jgi:hypothetical protein
MIDLSFPRDLVMIGAVFGLAAFIWSGWAQEAPPDRAVFRIILGGLSAAGLALAVPSIFLAIGNWSEPSAIATGTTAFTIYIVVVWAEIVAAAVLSFFALRSGHAEAVAPLILAIVGIHFFALAVGLRPAGTPPRGGAHRRSSRSLRSSSPASLAAPSFWCGVLGAPVLLAIGLWCLLAGRAALAAG